MVAGFFSRGGNVQKIPEASPTTADEVVDYLKSQRVEIAPGKTGDGKYTCNGDVISLPGLIQIANRRRRKQRRPLFDVSSTARR
jgi:hypothetical protein